MEQQTAKPERPKGMNYIQALEVVHRALKPCSYVEIGCRFGDSLKLADCPSIGIDPVNRLKYEFGEETKIFDEASDDFFAARSVSDVLGGPFDFGFIDGMHLAEYALRDFINMEANAHRGSVIAIDDTLPARNEFAEREPVVNAWTGDVYRVLAILKDYRPDLRITAFSVAVKGFTLVDRLDPTSTVLRDRLDEITARIEAGDFMVEDVSELKTLYEPLPVSELKTFVVENIGPYS